MEHIFNCLEPVDYNGTRIMVHWIRNEYKKKSEIRFSDDDRENYHHYQKDYITFTYHGIEAHDSYEESEHDLASRVWGICSVIDSGNYDKLTEMGVTWKRSE